MPLDLVVESPETVDGRVRLAARVDSTAGRGRRLWFALDARHRDAVVPSADPFVLAALFPAMCDGGPLRVRGAPVSPSLLSGLAGLQQVFRAWWGHAVVSVEPADLEEREPPSGDAVVSFSGGVDSTYTVYRHVTGAAGRESRPIGAAVMAHGFDIPRADRDGFAGASDRAQSLLDAAGVELITVETNLRAIVPRWRRSHGLALGSALTLLGGRFGVGLIAASAVHGPEVEPWGSNPLTDPMMGSAGFAVGHDGDGATRVEKLEALGRWHGAFEQLRFCWKGEQRDRNCGRCRKCVTAAATLRCLGLPPACFDAPVPEHTIIESLRRAPRDHFSRVYREELLAEADRRGLEEPWVHALRRGLRRARARDAFTRTANRVTPVTARRMAGAIRRAVGSRATRREPQ